MADDIGDVEVTYQDGTAARITDTGRCTSPAISPDRTTAAWLNVPQENIDKGTYYSREIIIFRGGAVLRTLDFSSFGDFVFSPDNKHIVVASPSRMTKEFGLVDIDTGTVVASCPAPGYQEATTVPDWAQAIAKRNG